MSVTTTDYNRNPSFILKAYENAVNLCLTQTWDYIKNVVKSSGRRSQLKGGGLFLEDPNPRKPRKHVVAAVWPQKSAK